MGEDYKSIIENAGEAIVVIDDGLIIYINQYTADVLGYEKADIIGKYFLDFIAEDHKKNVQERYKQTISGEKTFIYEANFVRKDGSILSGEICAQKIKYNNKDVNLVIIRDITARKKAEEVFYLQEERFHGVTENIPDVVARFDKEYRYVYINTAGENTFGISKKDVFWKTDKDLGIDDERTEAFREAIDFVFEKREKKTFYSDSIVAGERRYYYTILVPEFFKDGEVNSVLSIMRDITEIREIDQIKSEFISITSHQLRSPLAVINWCVLSLLRGEVEDSKEDEREYLEKIESSTRKLIKITDVFLNTTMLDLEIFTFNFKEIDIVKIAKEIMLEFEPIIKKKDIVFNNNFGDFSLIKFDERVLKIVFRGLLSNATEYTLKGGNIDFILRKEGSEEISLEVGDDGCGVPQEDQKKIFTKFYRAESARNMRAYGTGLDLYLIKSVLNKIGGSIELQSPNPKFGRGSVFYVKFSISNEEVFNS